MNTTTYTTAKEAWEAATDMGLDMDPDYEGHYVIFETHDGKWCIEKSIG